MLNTVTLKRLGAPVVHMHRERHRNRAFGVRRPFTVALVDVQIIGDDAKLLASHLENFIVVNRVHRCVSATLGLHGKLLFALGMWRRQLGNFGVRRHVAALQARTCPRTPKCMLRWMSVSAITRI